MRFKFAEYDTVCLKQDLPNEILSAGSVGAIVMRFSEPHEAYEVEFCDEHGIPVSVSETVLLLPNQLDKHSNSK